MNPCSVVYDTCFVRYSARLLLSSCSSSSSVDFLSNPAHVPFPRALRSFYPVRLSQEILTDEAKRCMVGLNRLQVVLACLAGKLLGSLIGGGIGSLDGGEAPNDLRSAVEAEVKKKTAADTGVAGALGRQHQSSAETASGSSSAARGGGAGGAGSSGRTAGASNNAERGWLQSPLLANGIVAAAGAGGGAVSARGSTLGAGMVDDENAGMGPVGPGPIEVFLRDLVEGVPESPALALSQWVSKHVGENPVLARTGGPLIARGVRGAVVAMLWHSGYAAAAQRMAAALAATPAAARVRVNSQVPPYFLLETWRKAAGLKSWAKSRRDRGTPYEATAADLTRHCRFLLSLHAASGDRPVGWLVQEFKAFTAAAVAAAVEDSSPASASAPSAAPAIPRRRSPSPSSRGLQTGRSLSGGSSGSGGGRRWAGGLSSVAEAGAGSLLRALETRHSERLSLVMGFLKAGVDLCRLRATQIAADERAKRRAAGLRALRSLLGSTGREGSSGVKAALLLYVPPALRGVLHGLAALGPDPIALQVWIVSCFACSSCFLW